MPDAQALPNVFMQLLCKLFHTVCSSRLCLYCPLVRDQFLWHFLGPNVPAGLQEMIDEADRDGDGEVNEEEFFRCLFCLAQRLWSTATCAQLFNVHCVECHVLVFLVLNEVTPLLCIHGPMAGVLSLLTPLAFLL